MKKLKARALNPGHAKGEAVVFKTPFSFIGDMSPQSGEVTMARHENFGKSLKDKVLIFETGRGGTIAPYILYRASKNGVAPCAIVCNKADMLTLECALTVDIPIIDGFEEDITDLVKNGDVVEINDSECTIL